MAFESLDISITGDSADAVSALQNIKSSLRRVDRSADSASDSLEETGDSASGLAFRLSGLSASAGTTAAALLGLDSIAAGTRRSMLGLGASTATVIAGLLTLSAVATPLVATLGGVATAGSSVAAVFGGGFLAAATTETERLKGALNDAKEGILDAIAPLGEAFADALIPLIQRLPSVAEQVVDAIGPLNDFTDTVRDAGDALLDAVPGIAAFAANLAREALPVLRDLVSGAAEDVPSAIRTMLDTTRRLGDDLLSLVEPTREFINTLLEVGTPLVEDIIPAIKLLLRPLGTALTVFNEVARSDGAQETFQQIKSAVTDLLPSTDELIAAGRGLINFLRDIVSRQDASEIFTAIRQEIVPLIPRVIELGKQFKPVLAALVDNLPEIIRGVGAFADTVLDIAETVAPVVVPVLTAIVNIIGDIAGAFADFVAASERSEKRLATVLSSIRQMFASVAGRIKDAWSYLTGTGAGSLVGDIKGKLNSLRSFFASQFDLAPLTSLISDTVSDIKSSLKQVVPQPVIDAISGLIGDIKTAIAKLNELSNVSLDLPDVNLGGGGDGGADQTGGGIARPSAIGVSAATGGLIESTGAAVVHEGERVVPSAQVVDRGPAPVEGGGGPSAGDLRAAVAEALAGATLSIDGDVASIEDVDRRVEERQRRTARRLDARNIR